MLGWMWGKGSPPWQDCKLACECSLTHSGLTLCASMNLFNSCPAPLSMECSRQEYWSVLPFLTPRNLPNPGTDPHLLNLLHWLADSLPIVPFVQAITITQFLQIPIRSKKLNCPLIQRFHFQVFAQKTQDTNSKRCMHSHVHSSIISHNLKKQPRYGSNLSVINRQMDKEEVVCVLFKILAIKMKSCHSQQCRQIQKVVCQVK